MAIDRGRLDEEPAREHFVAVVLHHSGEEHVGPRATVEVCKVFLLEGLRDLDGSITSKVEEHDPVSVPNPTDRSRTIADDKRGQVLIDHARVLGAK